MKLTTSEARAEACTVVLWFLLRSLPKEKLASLRAAALGEAKSIGHPDITEEIEFILHAAETA